MAAEEKSESINFDNEQMEQKTLGSDEERQIKKQEENKTFNKSKEGNIIQSKYNKTKLPPIKKGKKGKQLYKGMHQSIINSFNNQMGNYSIDDEELYPEIKIVKKEIRSLNKELKNLKNEYYIMEEQNLTYKFMIEKILNSKKNQVVNNNNENDNDEAEENYMKEKLMESEEEMKNNEKQENEQSLKKKK